MTDSLLLELEARLDPLFKVAFSRGVLWQRQRLRKGVLSLPLRVIPSCQSRTNESILNWHLINSVIPVKAWIFGGFFFSCSPH